MCHLVSAVWVRFHQQPVVSLNDPEIQNDPLRKVGNPTLRTFWLVRLRWPRSRNLFLGLPLRPPFLQSPAHIQQVKAPCLRP